MKCTCPQLLHHVSILVICHSTIVWITFCNVMPDILPTVIRKIKWKFKIWGGSYRTVMNVFEVRWKRPLVQIPLVMMEQLLLRWLDNEAIAIRLTNNRFKVTQLWLFQNESKAAMQLQKQVFPHASSDKYLWGRAFFSSIWFLEAYTC